MKTIEEIFTDTKAIFAAQATEAMEQAMSVIYEEYLPHVESDTQSNVYFQTCDWLRKFFEGKLESDDIKLDFSGYSAHDARQKIYEENKEEITKAIGRDLEDKIESLKAELNAVYRRY